MCHQQSGMMHDLHICIKKNNSAIINFVMPMIIKVFLLSDQKLKCFGLCMLNALPYLFYLFIYLFASDTHNLDHMHPYQLLVAVVKKKENSVSG